MPDETLLLSEVSGLQFHLEARAVWKRRSPANEHLPQSQTTPQPEAQKSIKRLKTTIVSVYL